MRVKPDGWKDGWWMDVQIDCWEDGQIEPKNISRARVLLTM